MWKNHIGTRMQRTLTCSIQRVTTQSLENRRRSRWDSVWNLGWFGQQRPGVSRIHVILVILPKVDVSVWNAILNHTSDDCCLDFVHQYIIAKFTSIEVQNARTKGRVIIDIANDLGRNAFLFDYTTFWQIIVDAEPELRLINFKLLPV